MEIFNLGDIVLDILFHPATPSFVTNETLQHGSHLPYLIPFYLNSAFVIGTTDQTNANCQIQKDKMPKREISDAFQNGSHHVQLGAAGAGIPSRHLIAQT